MSWFNVGAPLWRIKGHHLCLWNCFNRRTSDGDHWWGVGLLQIDRRHLLFVGRCGISVAFVGETT